MSSCSDPTCGRASNLSDGSGPVTGANPLGLDVSKCIVSPGELMRLAEVMGVPAAERYLDYLQGVVKVMAPMHFSSVRASSAASSRSGSQVSSRAAFVRSSASAAARFGKYANVSSWRAKSVPDGLCYSKVLRGASSVDVVTRLGKWPQVSSLLRLEAKHFLPLSELERFRVVGDGECVHVEAGGKSGSSFLASMSSVLPSVGCPAGSFGEALSSYRLPVAVSGSVPPLGMSPRTSVGGLSTPAKAVESDSSVGLASGMGSKVTASVLLGVKDEFRAKVLEACSGNGFVVHGGVALNQAPPPYGVLDDSWFVAGDMRLSYVPRAGSVRVQGRVIEVSDVHGFLVQFCGQFGVTPYLVDVDAGAGSGASFWGFKGSGDSLRRLWVATRWACSQLSSSGCVFDVTAPGLL